ncbi:MDR family MFS transporter [Phycicoccus duodecadis]|uniref:EmrB/QacA subfamily drug resistance transporter n=1 Tax=Phycicoccus duodecadis TaxID=173053 RepID=A0A2N3YLH3_9MICO|nr:MDR family MFS transporter [Phycicoccus duodecadis]PKW27707.1 EmrB/QacA subfamily drug resistance transporter [Phycicoccus duodecadis]
MTTSTAARVPRADVGLRSARGPVLLAVMLSTGLVAIDATILATAVPAVVRDLGGLTQFPWLFSIYVLAQAVSVPVYGKIADLYGRKTVMLVGIGLFVVGSLLCGAAWSMGSLIAFRALQGLGAGAIQPIGMTIVGDIYSVAERATVQGYIASVWAVASLVGPTLGGVFSEALTWRWIFFVNLPLGLAAAWMLWRRFSETPRPAAARPRIDYAGTVLLLLGTVALLVALLEGGVLWGWASPVSIGLFVASVVLLVAFVVVERRAAEPVLPLWVFRHRVVGGAMLVSLVVGVMLLGLTSYVPLYAQGVLGTGAIVAGFALAAMTIGWPIAASTAGRLYLRLGFRTTMLIGSVFAVLGSGILLLVRPSSSVWLLAGACLVLGLGFGYVASPSLVAAQSAVAWNERGVATSASIFARSVGSAVGVAAFGAVANTVVHDRLGRTPDDLESLPPGVLGPALQVVFLVAAAVSVTMLLASFVMPRTVQEAGSDHAVATS